MAGIGVGFYSTFTGILALLLIVDSVLLVGSIKQHKVTLIVGLVLDGIAILGLMPFFYLLWVLGVWDVLCTNLWIHYFCVQGMDFRDWSWSSAGSDTQSEYQATKLCFVIRNIEKYQIKYCLIQIHTVWPTMLKLCYLALTSMTSEAIWGHIQWFNRSQNCWPRWPPRLFEARFRKCLIYNFIGLWLNKRAYALYIYSFFSGNSPDASHCGRRHIFL